MGKTTTLLLWAAALLLFFQLLVLVLENRVTFHPLPGETFTPADVGIRYRNVWVATEDGNRIHGWWIPHPKARAEVVFFQGNAGNLSLWSEFLLEIHSRGFSLLAFNYRGYGRSEGAPSEKGLYRDCRAVVEYFWSSLHSSERPVVYWGRSLGGVTAAYSAGLREPDGIILEATFPDKNALLRHYPLLRLLAVFSRYRLDTLNHLEGVESPILIVHGNRDRIVPFPLGLELEEGLGGNARLITVEGAGHNDLHQVSPGSYWKGIDEFLESLAHG